MAKPVAGNAQGALWIIASGLTFSVAMALVKFLSTDFPPAVQSFFRQMIGCIVLLPLIVRNPQILTTSRPLYMLGRGAAISVGLILSYTSYQYLGLAEANALSFTRQLFMVPLAIAILGEKPQWQRIVATLVGFSGVLVILQPGGHGSLIGFPALCGLFSSMLVAWAIIGMKSMSRDHSGLTLLAWSAVLGTLFTLPGALWMWRTPNLPEFGLLATMGILGLVTQSFYIRGMAMGDATVLAPLDYVRIVFMIALGYLLFRQLPSLPTYAGSAIVIVAAIYITLQARRSAAAAPAPIEPA